MEYKKLYELVKNLNGKNVEKNKPELMKYLIGLMMNIKEINEEISLDELQGLFDIYLLKQEVKKDIEEMEGKKLRFGLLTYEFMKVYKSFIDDISNRGYTMDAISITKNALKGIGGEYREILVVKKNIKDKEEDFSYLYTKNHLNDLINELRKHLKQNEEPISREQFNILGLIEYIKIDLDERLEESTNTILNELKEKSLNEFMDERKEVDDECEQEYTNTFKASYIEELKRRKYEWAISTEKLKQPYFLEQLYSYLKE